MNWVDAIAILPYFVTLLMEWLSQSDWDMFGEVKLKDLFSKGSIFNYISVHNCSSLAADIKIDSNSKALPIFTGTPNSRPHFVPLR